MRVLVLDGNENQAVAATRSLARAGYEVRVGATEAWSKAGWSRFASASFTYPSPGDEPRAFIAAVVRELKECGGGVVMPMTERSTIPVSLFRDELSSAGGRFVLPPHEVLLRVFDKSGMTELARSLGVAVPRTWTLSSDTSAVDLASTLVYPVVLKPSMSQRRDEHGGSEATGAPLYAKNSPAFVASVAAMRQRCDTVLVQEFVQGTGAGYFALMHQGELRGEFAHRRIRDVRPTGSGSALRESVAPSQALRDASLTLLKAVGWHGAAMVEFRIRADGTPVFLEINGRFWNSLALAIHAGVDFPTGVARMAEFGDTEPLNTARAGVRTRWLLGDLRHLTAVLAGAPAGYPVAFPSRVGTLLSVLTPTPGTHHDNFELADPLPELGDFIDFFARRIPRAVMKKLRGTS